MKKLAEVYAQSWKEVRHVRSLTTAAMFMAVSVVLGYFTIEAGPYLKIGFGNVANEFVYYLFGPVLGVVYGCLLDLVKFVAKPTGAFFPGFTMVTMLAALIYGTFFYRRTSAGGDALRGFNLQRIFKYLVLKHPVWKGHFRAYRTAVCEKYGYVARRFLSLLYYS